MTSVAALLAAAADASSDVRGAIEASLIQLAAASADAVLAPAIELLGAASRPPPAQRACVLRAATAIVRKAAALSDALAASLLECGVAQLLATQHAEPVEAASELLLVLAERSDAEAAAVTHALLKHCEAGTLAAPCVLRALADVASAAPTATVPLLKAELLPRLLPMLGSVRRLPNARSLAFLRLSRVASTSRLPALCSRHASARSAARRRQRARSTSDLAHPPLFAGARLRSSLRPRVPAREIRRRRRSNRGRAAERATAVGRHAGGPAAAAHRRARLRRRSERRARTAFRTMAGCTGGECPCCR